MKKLYLFLLIFFSGICFAQGKNEKEQNFYIQVGNTINQNNINISVSYLFYNNTGVKIEYLKPNFNIASNLTSLNIVNIFGLPNELKNIKFHGSLGVGYYWNTNFKNTNSVALTYDIGLDFPLIKTPNIYIGFHYKGYTTYNYYKKDIQFVNIMFSYAF